MVELLHEAVQPANLVYTLFLGLSILYWVFVILGAFDMDGLDFDFDMDVDMDVDIDSDVDVSGGGNFLSGVLAFFNLGKMPFMIIFSNASLWSWLLGIFSNHYWGKGDIVFAIMLFIPILFIALMITKIITAPLIPFFKNLGGDVEDVDYLGKTATVILPSSKNKMGQVKVIENDDVHILTTKVYSDNKNDTIKKGEEVIIIDKAKDGDYYWIENF